MRRSLAIAIAVLPWLLAPAGCGSRQQEDARAQVLRWAETLDARTTSAGTYIRFEGEHLPEPDPWGNPIAVSYERGGLSETLTVRSPGGDGRMFSDDDVIERRTKVSLAGVGNGIKENLGASAEEAARGAVRGAFRGLRDGIRRDEPGDPPSPDDPTDPPSPQPDDPA